MDRTHRDPEWVRRARARELASFVVGGVPVEEFRRTRQAHPLERGLDGDWDALADTLWPLIEDQDGPLIWIGIERPIAD